MTHTNTIVIGASAAGLAMAACLKKRNIPFILLEKGSEVGAAWRHHYDRLHLHTNKGASALPYFKFPSNYPKYPARDEVVRYLELYKAHFELKLVFGCEVKKVSRDDGKWKVLTTCGAFGSEHVVVCTGYTRKPNIPHWPGMEDFTGRILHSAAYKNGSAFRNQKVLVVGFGNSACEIAICLHEHNALPSLSVRGTVNNLPKEILGIPVLGIGIALSILPPKLADLIGKPAVRMTVGNPEKYGLKEAPYEPIEQIVRQKRIPLLDIGTLRLVREGAVTVYGAIDYFESETVTFEDGRSVAFDAIILGTGYNPGVHEFIQTEETVCDEKGIPLISGAESAATGLYFCGFYVSPTGMLREIGIESKKIARSIAKGM